MGNRPQDHMDRDLLLASLIRDRRLPMFRKQCREMPAWAPAVPENIPKNFERRAQELIMLGSHQQYLIEKMRDTIYLAADRCQGEKMLNAMEACLPRGALFDRTMPNPGRACGYARLCPWCHARSVQRLYRQLLAGPCTPERLAGKHLIVFRTRVEAGEDLHADEVRKARTEYRDKLRHLATEISMDGGVIIHQVTPWIPHYDRPEEKQKEFAHIFAMIGVVASSTVETLDGAIKELVSDLWLDWDYETTWLPAATPHAVRYVLCGSAYKFNSSKLGIVVNNWERLRFGIPGAAALEPLFLFDHCQAWSYAAAMQGTRLYDTFGTWRPTQAGGQRSSPKRTTKRGKTNSERHYEAYDRHRQLAKLALPYYQDFKDHGGKRLGSPALRKLLNDAGHAVSDRDARWLTENLPAMDRRTALDKAEARWKLATAHRRFVDFERVELQTAE